MDAFDTPHQKHYVMNGILYCRHRRLDVIALNECVTKICCSTLA